MPGLMARLSLIFKAKFSKALDRAENPNETLDYSYEEQLRQLQNVKRGIADVTTAQYSAAEAQVRIGEAATGIGEQMADVGLAVQRAKDKTEQMQARANAIDELTASGALTDLTSSGDDIDRQLAQISQGGQVD